MVNREGYLLVPECMLKYSKPSDSPLSLVGLNMLIVKSGKRPSVLVPEGLSSDRKPRGEGYGSDIVIPVKNNVYGLSV